MTFGLNLYWRCQFIGWLIVAAINFLIQMLRPNASWIEQLGSNLGFILLGIGCTHGLRFVYRRLRVVDLSIRNMILPLFGLSLITTIIMILVMFSVLSLTVATPAEIFSINMLLGNVIGVYPLILIWSCFYLGSQYLRRWRQSEVDKLALENALKDAQLNTLIGQINPHFMFNALNNIRGLMLEDVNRARDSLTLLAKVLRYGLTAPQQSLVSLQDELATVHDFIALASIQYEQRLQWQQQIDIALDGFQVPPMMVQMLVENAIKHGIALQKDGGTLKLHIFCRPQFLCIELSNTGTLTSQADPLYSTKLGLTNISQRLKLLYNNEAHFSLQQQGDTVVASLLLPLDNKEEP